MGRKCLKCGHERSPSDVAPEYECPKCGAVYAKVEAAIQRASGNEQALSDEEKIRAIKERAAQERQQKVLLETERERQQEEAAKKAEYLTQCKHCEKEVSKNAKTCPHCGVSTPGVTAKANNTGATILLGLILLLWLASKLIGPDGTAARDSSNCKADLQCWGDKNNASASVYCDDHIERLAKYNARWTDGALGAKFSHFRWLNKERATLTYIGDKIEFQNGFGAYQAHIYECDFDPASNTVLDVRARPGRL